MNESFSNLKINYSLIYRKIRFPRLEFKTGKLVLILPQEFENESDIIEKHKIWIEKTKKYISNIMQIADAKILDCEISESELQLLVNKKIDLFCKELNTSVNKIFFKNLTTKWASCSSNKNLTINKMMRYIPKHLLEYVIFHEIAHTIEQKHNKRFWNIVKYKFPNYQESENDLFIYWFLIQKIRGNK